MKKYQRTVLSVAFITGLLLAWLVSAAPDAPSSIASPAVSAAQVPGVREEVNAGTFEQPRLAGEPAFEGAVFSAHTGQSVAFYIAAFDSQPDQLDPALPDTPHSTQFWTYAGQHSGLGPDLKPFDEPTREGALHLAMIEGKSALLSSKISGVPGPQTPYPATAQSNDFWDFIGFFDKPGTPQAMKTDQDLVWPGVFVYFEQSKTVYLAQHTGRPGVDGWPAPGTEQGAGYWKLAGTVSNIPAALPKPWTDMSVSKGSYYRSPLSPLRSHYYASTFIGFAPLLNAEFPGGPQSNQYWDYRGVHEGSYTDQKAFGENTALEKLHRAKMQGKWVSFATHFSGAVEQPYPTSPTNTTYWGVRSITQNAGTWWDPRTDLDTETWVGAIHSAPQGQGKALYRALKPWAAPPTGWDYSQTDEFQLLGVSLHAGTVADPKTQQEFTWPGAVHETLIDHNPVYFVSLAEGLPSEHDWPLPATPESNEHWSYIPVIQPLGTFGAPRHFDDYSQAGSVYVDGTVPGKRTFFVSNYEGYPANDLDSFSTVGIVDPYWVYAGRHAGTWRDFKPFDDITRIGALHEASIKGQRAVLRSLFDGTPSAATPYPGDLASNAHWEFVTVFKHAGTADDLKGRDEATWPGALHLDENQHLIFAARQQAQPVAGGWIYPVGETSDDQWSYVSSLNGGSADTPRERNDINTPGAIFADQLGLTRQKLFRTRFSGFAQDVGAVYPSGEESNDFYEYAGEHAGTFSDPKPFTDPTWPDAVHVANINGQRAFLKSKMTGKPSSQTPYPEEPASTDFWEFMFTSDQAGTYADPKTLSGQTWVGAIHEYSSSGRSQLYIAQQSGSPIADNWPLPTAGDTQYWKVMGLVRHKGTFADPKGFDEMTSQGLIHATTIEGQHVYYRALARGVPQANDWSYPAPGTDNEYWESLGANVPEGTWADPKGSSGFTSPGRIHAVQARDRTLYLLSKVDGLLAENNWPIPQDGDNDYWTVVGESRHSGEIIDPKDQQEVTWTGAIHMRQDGNTRRYYSSKIVGNLAVIGAEHPLPVTETDNAWWTFIGRTAHEGTQSDPVQSGEVIRPGDTVKVIRTADEYYQARFAGIFNAERALPDSQQDNEDWSYIGKSEFAGTLQSPKDAYEITWPGAIHRFEVDGKAYFARSLIDGAPGQEGWHYPTPPDSNGQWSYLDMGIHAGSWLDPKPESDATWPGALHVVKRPTGIGESFTRSFYRSKIWGHVMDDEEGYGNENNFEHVGYSIYQGTLNSPKYFDQPTWAGAIHQDRETKFLFEAKKSGEMGVEVGERPMTPTDNESWHFVGISKHLGLLSDPKEWDEYTWPGRLHRYEHGGKTLYFRAQMTGTPSDHGWYYPTDESSTEQWAYYGTTSHAGTFAEPHGPDEVTWRGAIHRVEKNGIRFYFKARFAGIPNQQNWTYPTDATSNAYYLYAATERHAGTISDPKDEKEPVIPGDYVKTTRVDGDHYFIAKNSGVPSLNQWPFPANRGDTENWIFYGISRNAGTLNDPKEWDEVSWRGAVHVREVSGMRLLFSVNSDKEGIPEQDKWTSPPSEPLDADEEKKPPAPVEKSPAWKFLQVTHLNGTSSEPKGISDWTQAGLLHEKDIDYQPMLFRSKFTGKKDYPKNQPVKGDPVADESSTWWEFFRKGRGTFEVPNTWNDYAYADDIYSYDYNGERLLFRAEKEGRPADYGRYFPTSEYSTADWTYLYKNEGSPAHPKTWNEFTRVGEVHRYDQNGQTWFFKALQEGSPARHNWYYPVGETNNGFWTYAGHHAGTWQDPKEWDEPTYPGAIHALNNITFYRSKFSGNAAAHFWYYPTSGTENAYWVIVNKDAYAAPGINDFTKTFDKYTWATGHNAYLNDLTPQLERGMRGFMLDIHRDYAGRIRVCHAVFSDRCSSSNPLLSDLLKEFLAYLKKDRNAVISLLFESTLTSDELRPVLERVPEIADYSHVSDHVSWPTLQEMISTNKRLVMFSQGEVAKVYLLNGKKAEVLWAPNTHVENTFDLGNTAASHDWRCVSRFGSMALSLRTVDGKLPRTFVLNQFHSFGSSAAHAGDMDNNLTLLQRRVEHYCGEPTGWRNPNYLAVDFNQVGDTRPYAAALSQGGLYFYERNYADRGGDTSCVLPANQSGGNSGVQYDIRLPSNGCEKDEVRSMELEGVRAGTRIELYDNPNGDRQDDFTIIDVKQSVPMGKRVRIDSFEGTTDTFYYRKLASRNNGLDGKVSRIKVLNKPDDNDISDASIVFYEANGATQNIVCTVPFNIDRQFKMGSGNNSYGCDNDEIRSAKILKAGKGSVFSVTGSPEGGFSEGRTGVTFKRAILLPITISSFNRSYENADVKVEVSNGGGLDGKISYAYFRPASQQKGEPPVEEASTGP
ncbi:PI-PLC X phosphodiestherase-like domain protein [Pseudomonas sp. SZ57]|uniref:PI-PLC X phosphodiestherase-like domain protein n=1 Tax=Pseudomonas sp. SZ57 TaxID=2662259 RepID=UPI0012920404|nr:PI-PLC X phosphodiestherase-like domain protein [Pseudomonas sp. SZ57]MQQ37553.1 PI-PLC X phosphodiestherase-like domain protein [Pseudomonas sp. SZ57]